MRSVTIAAILAALFCLVGCGGGNKYVGQWNADIEGTPMTISFEGNGSLTAEADAPIPGASAAHVKILGAYETPAEDKLKITFKDVEVSNMPEQFKSMEGQFKEQMKAEMLKDPSKTFTVKWDGNDSFTTTEEAGGKSQTFTRKK
jgi:hypothetical protein